MKLPLAFCAFFCAALTASAADSVMVFNEIHYNPPAGQAEFIELRNLNAVDVNVGGWRIDGGVDFTIPAGTVIAGHGYLVIGAVSGAIGNFTGQLDSGEALRLRNFNGRIMDEVGRDDGGEWPVGADGSGATLARRTASAASGPGAWTASTQLGGTPGAQNFYEGGAAVTTRIIAIGDVWKFEDSGNAAPAGWQSVGFNDASWKAGATLIAGGGGKLGGGRARPSAFPTGLLAYWAFDETGGTVANNVIAGQPDGTMTNGATFVSDAVRGQVASFDGTNDRMEVIDTGTGLPSAVFMPAMTGANDFTWAAWVWSSTGSALADQSDAVIMGNRTNPSGADTSPREFVKIMPTAMQYHRNAATENLDYADLATSVWTHMCVVKRGLFLDYYRNGAFVQPRAISGGLSNPVLFYVGGDRRPTNSTAEHFQGRVDDVGLWTRALSAAEISQLGRLLPPLPTPPEQTTNAVAGPQPRYFRKAFSFDGAPSGATIELWPVADDGAVVYLNGVEIWRANVPPTVQVGDAVFTAAPISVSNAALINGANVLSAEVHQFPGGNNDLLFGADLSITAVPGPPPAPAASLTFNEISGASDAGFYVELRNTSASSVNTSGWSISASSGQTVALPAQSVAAGGFLTLGAAALGFTPADGTRLFLLAPGGTELRDAREVTNRLRGLLADGRWEHPSTATPNGANVAVVSAAIVINEIFYHAPGTSLEQWIELHNRSAAAVDIAGWKLTDGVGFDIPAGTTIPAGGFVVIAWDTAAFAALHAGVTALGPFSGSLSGKGELITLRDANDNITDQLHYYDSGRWSQWADGGGSSLELRDPDADNAQPEAWDSSDESGASSWQNVSYSGLATNPAAGDPTTWNEFVLGLLAGGECLIDDISVKNVTLGNVELIQNGGFGGGTAAFWRIIGNHAGTVVDDPTAPGNKVLKIAANGPTEHMHNHAETTLKQGASYHAINPAHTYNITFRAKWLRGSNRLHTRLYCNRLPRQTLLNMPATGGTPGAVNSCFAGNIGPTFDTLAHSPAVPAAGATATVSLKVADPDGLGTVQLFTSVNGAAFTSAAMTASGGGVYTGTVPAQSASTLVQFYVRATDTPGAVSFFPAAGPASRAMIPWNDSRAMLQLASGARPHNLRIVVPTADATELYKPENVMSNGAIPCTVILDEREVYYGAGFRLESSEHERRTQVTVGYSVQFGGDQPFLGAHETLSVDRAAGISTGQAEILIKTVSNVAGGVHAPEDDLIRIIPPIGVSPPGAYNGAGATGAAILSKTRFDESYLDNQFPDGGSGPVFRYERIYVLTETINTATRAVTTIDAANVFTVISEQPKVPQSTTSPPGVDVANLGANKEFYRWYWLIENARDGDDYTGLINAVTAVGQSGGSAAFNTQTAQYIDINAWLRATIPATLFGVIDNYLGAGGGQHNVLLYFPPGGKAVLFPWDLDFLNQSDPQFTLTAGGDLPKFLANSVNRRLFYGHLLDILNRSFNSSFLTTWATHYSRFGTEDMTAALSYLTQRATFARDVINGTGGQTAPIPFVAFARTSASPVSVSTPFATITGDGWIDIVEIRLQGSPKPVALTWTDSNSWTLQLPIAAGTNTYTLIAYNNTGAQLGTTSVTVTGTGGIFPAGPGNLVVSELHYNPAGSDDTEFLELLNITGATLDLSGCHFDEENNHGINYTFPAGVQVPTGGRLLVVRNRGAFMAAYPAAGPLAPGQFIGALDDSGETLVLYAASGFEIFRFAYNDSVAGTDGGGRSLVRVLSSTAPNPATYLWRASTADGGNPGATDAVAFTGAPLTDIDFDGLAALLEYALGTSPTSHTPPPWTFTRDTLGRYLFTFPRVLNADDVALTIESAAPAPHPWAPASAIGISSTTAGTIATETWQVIPPAGSTAFFVRLRATLR